MEIFLLIVVVLIALVIIGKLKGDPDIGKLDVAGLNGNAPSDKPKNIDQAAPPVMPDNESSQDFLIVHSMDMLTSLAASQGLIKSQEEAAKYWRLFKERIRNFHLKGKSVTL